MDDPERHACVIIATRDRVASLQRCLTALDAQQGVRSIRVVVVDDASQPPLQASDVKLSNHDLHIVRGQGTGPSAARNAGVAESTEPLIFFTDDDTVPSERWLASGIATFAENPQVLAVEGPVQTPKYDQLYEYSIEATGRGHYWTCNVAYRREALDAVGGFDVATFPRYREDRDLGYRVAAIGPTTFCSDMAIIHTPRPVALSDFYRLTAAARSDIALRKRHPACFDFQTWIPVPLIAVVTALRRAYRRGRTEGPALLKRDRLLRFVAVCAVELAASLYVCASNLVDTYR